MSGRTREQTPWFAGGIEKYCRGRAGRILPPALSVDASCRRYQSLWDAIGIWCRRDL